MFKSTLATSQKTRKGISNYLSPLMDYMCTSAPLRYNEALLFGGDQQQQGKSRLPKFMVKAEFQKQAFLFHFTSFIMLSAVKLYFLCYNQ